MNADLCVYIHEVDDLTVTTVDDIIIASRNEVNIMNIKEQFSRTLEIIDLGKVHHCLGVEFFQNEKEITMYQKEYIRDLLDRFGMADSNPTDTPLHTDRNWKNCWMQKIFLIRMLV